MFRNLILYEKQLNTNLHSEITDVLSRIERLNELLQLHKQQPVADSMAIEGMIG